MGYPDLGASRQDITRRVATDLAIPSALADQVVVAFLERVEEIAAAGRKVTLRGFGVFSRLDRPARTRRHPRTGASLQLPAQVTLRWAPARTLVRRLNGA